MTTLVDHTHTTRFTTNNPKHPKLNFKELNTYFKTDNKPNNVLYEEQLYLQDLTNLTSYGFHTLTIHGLIVYCNGVKYVLMVYKNIKTHLYSGSEYDIQCVICDTCTESTSDIEDFYLIFNHPDTVKKQLNLNIDNINANLSGK
jgi:hypothetical protein